MRKSIHFRRLGRRAGTLATLAALTSILVASVGATPAQAQDGVGVGTASARGTDPAAQLATGGTVVLTVEAQFSAITNCDETQNTRPFIVRWVSEGTTYTFRRTNTGGTTASCFSDGGANISEGDAFGTVTGGHGGAATVRWHFEDGAGVTPDNASITVLGFAGDFAILTIETAPPEPLRGTPGGVWAFGDLPWP